MINKKNICQLYHECPRSIIVSLYLILPFMHAGLSEVGCRGTGLELSTMFIQVNVSSKLATLAISIKDTLTLTFSKFRKSFNYGRYYGRSFLTFKAKTFYHNFVGRKHINIVPNGCSTLRDILTALS